MNQATSKDTPLVDMEEFESWILYEDEHILVINKPGWLVCHPSKNGPLSSLVGASKEYLGFDTLHLASRLDRETSGVVLLAKHRKSAGYWQKGIEKKRICRSYLAIVEGKFPETQKISTFLGKDPSSVVYVKQRVTQESRKSKHATSIFSPIISNQGYTLCSVQTLTGRKHQIRIHAQWAGFPLVGEKLYGKDENIYLDFCTTGWRDEWLSLLGMHRQALHGRCLFDMDEKNKFLAPLPKDLTHFIHYQMGLNLDDINSLINQSDEKFIHAMEEN